MKTLIKRRLVCALVLLHAMHSNGQELQLLQPTGPFVNGFSVESLGMTTVSTASFSTRLSIANNPLDVVDPISGERQSVINRLTSNHIGAAWQQTRNLSLHIGFSARYLMGPTYREFEGDGYALGDTVFGLRWRLINSKKYRFQLGFLGNVIAPTGHPERLSGTGSTSLQAGLMLNQKLDALSIQANLSYLKRTAESEFADNSFADLVNYQLSAALPLDWADWQLFGEFFGQFDVNSKQETANEPSEWFAGLSFGHKHQLSIGVGAGLNRDPGSASRRFGLRWHYHFGESDSETWRKEQLARNEGVAEPTSKGVGIAVVESSPIMPSVREPLVSAVQASKPEDDHHSRSPVRDLAPMSEAVSSPDQQAKIPNPSEGTDRPLVSTTQEKTPGEEQSSLPSIPVSPLAGSTSEERQTEEPAAQSVEPSAPDQPKKSSLTSSTSREEVLKVRKNISETQKNPQTFSEFTATPLKKSPSETKPTSSGPPATVKGSKVILTSTPIQKPSTVAKNKPKLVPKTLKDTTQVQEPTNANPSDMGSVDSAWGKPAQVTPIMPDPEPLSRTLLAGQVDLNGPDEHGLTNELKAALKKQPSAQVIVVNAFAGPGERTVDLRTRTYQRDAYLLAKARAESAIKSLKGAFPQLKFSVAPQIWPPVKVSGGDYWGGIRLELKSEGFKEGKFESIRVSDEPSTLRIELQVNGIPKVADVDIREDGADVLIVRVKNVVAKREWKRLRHPLILRALVHPSYETARSGILRIRLKRALTPTERAKISVSVLKNTIAVAVPLN